MTEKTFCDICKKDITDPDNATEATRSIRLYTSGYNPRETTKVHFHNPCLSEMIQRYEKEFEKTFNVQEDAKEVEGIFSYVAKLLGLDKHISEEKAEDKKETKKTKKTKQVRKEKTKGVKQK